MKTFTTSQILKVSKSETLNNSINFSRKGKKYNVVYSTDLDKWYLNSTNSKGEYITLGEIK